MATLAAHLFTHVKPSFSLTNIDQLWFVECKFHAVNANESAKSDR